jgi:predicted RNA binding protein YcfA (HicA-like mRNA interferase family)
LKYREIIKLIENEGWKLDRVKGSHFQFRHPTKTGTVTIACGGKMNADVPNGTLGSILKQAGIK